MDGGGPVVETVAQVGSQMDREVQHEENEHSTGQAMLPEWTTKKSVRRN